SPVVESCSPDIAMDVPTESLDTSDTTTITLSTTIPTTTEAIPCSIPDDILADESTETELSETPSGDNPCVEAIDSSIIQSTERQLSEDSNSSGILSNGRTCSFCNCGENSLLGQGVLSKYDPTPGFNPFKRILQRARRTSSEMDEKGNDKNPKHLTWRRPRGPSRPARERSKSPRRPNPHSIHDEDGRPMAIVDELSLIGHSEDVDVHQVYEITGHVWGHQSCACWSEGVTVRDDDSLQFVDRAVFAGLTQKCSYCNRYGATITCGIPRCTKKYHYPCAASSGCFQDIKGPSLLCPDHIDQAETIAGQQVLCITCGKWSGNCSLLFCTTCGDHYHGHCLQPTVAVQPAVRAGWQCPKCKLCLTCKQSAEEGKMLFCDNCDK
ncbi:hypothetical protein Ahia01_000305800, partial [Argonauta hians]